MLLPRFQSETVIVSSACKKCDVYPGSSKTGDGYGLTMKLPGHTVKSLRICELCSMTICFNQ